MSQKKNTETQEVDKTAVADNDTLKIRLEEAKAASPVIVIISGKPLGKNFFLSKERSILGRDLAADISIGETSISRQHTEFVSDAEGIRVGDMGSTNGTFVNDQPLTKGNLVLLNDGDLIRCGNTIFKFLKEGKIENIHYAKMYDQATVDDLTGAYNKKTVLDMLGEDFARAQARGTPLTLLMLDLDHFKKINDTYGHMAGDYVLKETCSLIKDRMIRQKDALGRYGGEEFALLLRDTPLQVAAEVAERIRKTIEGHGYRFDGKDIRVTMSIGVSSLDSTCKIANDLLDHADKALYDAKNQGRNRVCIR